MHGSAPAVGKDFGRAYLFPVLRFELLFECNRARAERLFIREAFGDDGLSRPCEIQHVLARAVVEACFDAQFALAVSVEPDHGRLYRTSIARWNNGGTSDGFGMGARVRKSASLGLFARSMLTRVRRVCRCRTSLQVASPTGFGA